MEEWRDVPGYEGLYKVSNIGRVKSLNYNHTNKEKILDTFLVRNYVCINLWRNRRFKQVKVHRIVYEAFIGPIPKGMQVNHINENKTDNRPENLNLMTPKENVNWGTGIKRRAKLKNKIIEQYDLDGNYIRDWPSQTELVKYLNVSTAAHISECCHGKRLKAHNYIWKFKEGTV